MLPAKPLSEMSESEILEEIRNLRTRRVAAKTAAVAKRENKAKPVVKMEYEEASGDLAGLLSDIIGSDGDVPEIPSSPRKRGRPRKPQVISPDLDNILQGLIDSQAENE